jgi:transcriptional regulator GlxA family with amidase domain
MKHVTIIVHHAQTNLSTIVGIHEVFLKANQYWRKKGMREPLQIQLAGTVKKVEFAGGLFSVRPQCHISSIKKTDLIIIPAVSSTFEETDKTNMYWLDWIKKQYKEGAEIASICSGAFLLAFTGLLDGKHCSTHWALADQFKIKFPNVHLQADKLITDEHRIYTNGGAYSFLNLLIYLIEKFYDRQTAIYCAKIFQVEIDRISQSSFTIFTGQKSHGDEIIVKAQDFIESRITKKISAEDLASKFAIGRRNFDRRFVKATGNTPLEYAQRVKIEAAKKLFENSNKTISEVMFSVGYSDTKAFREVFRRFTGMAPLEYRNRYNKDTVFL